MILMGLFQLEIIYDLNLRECILLLHAYPSNLKVTNFNIDLKRLDLL